MKTYKRHRCHRRHRTYRAFAQCAWRWHFVEGEGAYAFVNDCRPKEVVLYETEDEARRQKKLEDDVGCSGGCSRDHCVIRLELPGPPGPESG